MGIAGFQKWLRSGYPSSVDKVPPTAHDTFDYVCIDVNHILHSAAHRSAKKRDKFPTSVFSELNNILNKCRPRKAVIMAMDGAAPLGKIATARKRREVAVRKSDEKSSIYMELTPGTELMYELNNALQYFICQRLNDHRRYLQMEFFFSGSDVPGEGEIKILDFLKSAVAPQDPTASVIVVGGDSDIILQGLCTPELSDFFVFIPSSNKIDYVVTISKLGSLIDKSLGDHRLDFVLICILNGNDYLPKLPGLGIVNTLARYRRMRRRRSLKEGLVRGAPLGINWDLFCQLIDKRNLMDKIRKGLPLPTALVSASDDDDEDDENLDDDSVKGDDDAEGMDDEMEDDEDDMEVSDAVGEQVEQPKGPKYDVELYLQGLLWNMQLYIDGYPPNQLFHYNYRRAPPVWAVLEFIFSQGTNLEVNIPVSDEPAILPNVALTLMLPPPAASLVPDQLREIVNCGIPDGDFSAVKKKVERIPFHNYTDRDRRYITKGRPFHFFNEQNKRANFTLPRLPMDNPKFRPISRGKLQRRILRVTDTPPLRTWTGLWDRRNRESRRKLHAFSAFIRKKGESAPAPPDQSKQQSEDR